MDDKLINGALEVIDAVGIEGLNLERLAVAAGRNRVTLWRQGVTREGVLEALHKHLFDLYSRAIWPALASDASAMDRLRQALAGICRVVESQLPFIAATGAISDTLDHAIHACGQPRDAFSAPLERIILDGVREGEMQLNDTTTAEAASIVLNGVVSSYVHLRRAHQWQQDRTVQVVTDVLTRGVVAPSSRAQEEGTSELVT